MREIRAYDRQASTRQSNDIGFITLRPWFRAETGAWDPGVGGLCVWWYMYIWRWIDHRTKEKPKGQRDDGLEGPSVRTNPHKNKKTIRYFCECECKQAKRAEKKERQSERGREEKREWMDILPFLPSFFIVFFKSSSSLVPLCLCDLRWRQPSILPVASSSFSQGMRFFIHNLPFRHFYADSELPRCHGSFPFPFLRREPCSIFV